jgi:hypothetical protein
MRLPSSAQRRTAEISRWTGDGRREPFPSPPSPGEPVTSLCEALLAAHREKYRVTSAAAKQRSRPSKSGRCHTENRKEQSLGNKDLGSAHSNLAGAELSRDNTTDQARWIIGPPGPVLLNNAWPSSTRQKYDCWSVPVSSRCPAPGSHKFPRCLKTILSFSLPYHQPPSHLFPVT